MRLLVLGLAVVAAGCVSAQTFRSGTGQVYAPTNSADVLVFYSPADVSRPYEVIGEITAAGSSGWSHNEGDLMKKARKEAARMGANAIIVRSIDKGSSGDHAMAVLFGSNDKTGRVTAIRFVTRAAVVTPSTPPPAPRPIGDVISDCNRNDDSACAQLAPRLQVECETDPAMCMPLGYLYKTGRGVPRDPFKALGLFTRACDSGQTKACEALAQIRAESNK